MTRISILLILLCLLTGCDAAYGPLEPGPLPAAPTVPNASAVTPPPASPTQPPASVVPTALTSPTRAAASAATAAPAPLATPVDPTAAPAPLATLVVPTAAPAPLTAMPSAAPPAGPLTGAIVASVYRNWDWDIYTLSPAGVLLRRLTFGEGDNRAPDWSPDGSRIAFESNRGHNWDIYSLRADGTDLRRLTDDPHFDGSPRWSPDGSRIAFSSDRAGSLDIWVMAADGPQPVNLTADSSAGDYDPAWSPDGRQLAFTSLREGSRAVFVMNADGSNVRRLTPAGMGDAEQPAWSPDGGHIALVAEQNGAREIYQVDPAGPLNAVRVTSLEYHQWPAWLPDGSGLLFVAQSEKGQALERVQPGHPAQRISSDSLLYRQPAWSARAAVAPEAGSLQQTDEPLYVEKTTPNPPDHPDRYNMVRLNGVRVIVPALSDTVDDSFNAARLRVAQESGWDYLASLAEAMRPLAFKSDASDYLSWHKAGRAIDLSFTYPTHAGDALEIAREDELGDTYWRLYLRAASQDGSQGEPLREPVWDLSAEGRQRAKGQGGLVKGVLPGYYVDVTELLRQYGWRRIASHTEPSFYWQRDYAAIEFWHYQKTDGLTWWAAIQEIYPPKDLGDLFSYQALVRANSDISILVQKGIPIPPDVMLKYATLQP